MSRDTVIFVHGMFEPSTVWSKMATAVANGVCCATINLRANNPARTIRKDVGNVKELVDSIPEGGIIFVAHSYGCLVTLLALMDEKVATRVKGVILLAPVLGRSFPFEFWKRLILGVTSYWWPMVKSLFGIPSPLRLTDADARALINVHGECTDDEANELYGEFEAESASLCREFAFFAPRVKLSIEVVGRVYLYAGKHDVIADARGIEGMATILATSQVGMFECGHILPISDNVLKQVILDIREFVSGEKPPQIAECWKP